MEEIWVLVPMMALAIPLTAVVGRVVVKPIVDAISKLAAAQSERNAALPSGERLLQMEERLYAMERMLGRIEEEQDFQRKLLGSRGAEVGSRPSP